MKYFNLLSALCLALFFPSCTNEIPFYSNDFDSKLIVNAIIDINRDDNVIFLSKTGKHDIDSIREATVNIYINDELKEQITEHKTWPIDTLEGGVTNVPVFTTKHYEVASRFRPGDKVRIEVFADNQYHAWTEDIIPYPIEIEHIDTLTIAKDYLRNLQFKMTFTDRPNEANFYRLSIVQKVSFTYFNEKDQIIPYSYETVLLINTQEDIVLNDGRVSIDNDFFTQSENIYAVFDDSRLNGTYNMITGVNKPTFNLSDPTNIPRLEFTVHLLSITEAQYHYLKALNILQSDNYDDYLSTPVVLPSNIEGGIGFVGFTSGTNRTFSVPTETITYPY